MCISGQYYLPLFFQAVLEASPIRSGLLLLPLLLTESAVGLATGVVIHRTGRYIELIRAGKCLMTLGTGLYISFSATSSLPSIIAFQLVAGLGTGLLYEPPLIAIQAAVPQERTATATASLGLARSLATGLSIVVGGVIFQNGMQSRASEMRASGVPGDIVALLTTGGGAAANVGVARTIADPAGRLAVRQAFAWSMRNMWVLYTCMSGCGMVASWFLRHRSLSEEHVEVRTGLKKD